MSEFDDFIIERLEEIRLKLAAKDYAWFGRDADLLSILIASQIMSISGAETRLTFPTLEGAAAEALTLRRVQEGDPIAEKNASIAFSFKDYQNNAIAPQLTSEGRLKVDLERPILFAYGEDDNNSIEAIVVFLNLTPGKTYRKIEIVSSSFENTNWKCLLVNDPQGAPTTTQLFGWVTTDRQPTVSIHQNLDFTAGTTSPVLRIIGKTVNKKTFIKASVSIS